VKKKHIIFVIFSCGILALAAIVSSVLAIRANNSNIHDHYLSLCTQCADAEGDEIKELFDMYENGDLLWIQRDNADIKKESELLIRSNGYCYHIGIPGGRTNDTAYETYLRACEIYDDLFGGFPLTGMRYYEPGRLEIYFEDDIKDVEYFLVYSNEAPEDVYKKEAYVKIKDNFYFGRHYLYRL
jgi:hypothetical protein